MPKSTAASVYQLKITLAQIKPPIWRKVLLKDCTLLKLNQVILSCMGWYGGHLWAFDVGGEEYGDDPSGEMDLLSARKIKLSQIVAGGVKKFRYTYDFGDNWEHIIQIEKVLDAEAREKYPLCIDGKRACPPEDCGGVWGYEELVEAVKDPAKSSEHLEWLGGEFDPEKFDVAAVNEMLR